MTAHAPQAAPTPDYSRKWWAMLGVAMGVFMSTIDGSIVNVALPTLQQALHTSFATVQWVAVSYLLVSASLVLGITRLADMIGKKRIYQIGMVIFTLGSLLCGLAPSVGFLIAFRVLQGTGAVMLQGLGIAIITENFPASERGRALGIIGTVVSIGISVGPTLGGVLLDAVGWRAIFLVNLPVGVLGVLIVHRHVPARPPIGKQRFDLAGALIVLLTLLALALGLTFAPTKGWVHPAILALLGGAAVGLVVFVWVELHHPHPMLAPSLFRRLPFDISLINGWLVFVIIGAMFVLPFYLDLVKGYDPREIGLFLTVVPAALGITAPIAGALSDRYGSRGISFLGLVVVSGACLAVATLDEGTTVWGYIVRLFPLGVGMGLFQSPNNSAIMGDAPPDRLGVVSGLLALTRTLGQVVGIPLAGAIFASRVFAVANLSSNATDAPAWAIVVGVQAVFLAAAGLALWGALLSAYAWHIARSGGSFASAPPAGDAVPCTPREPN